MLLSIADIECLETVGYARQEFMLLGNDGFVRLKNCRGFCFFYDIERCRCRVYRHRPLGCRIYPAIHSELEGIVVDDLCPMKATISKSELKRKGKQIMALLQKIDWEANQRVTRLKSAS